MYRRFCEEDEVVFISAGIRGMANAGKETAMIFYYTFLVIVNSLQLFLIWKYNYHNQKRSA